MCSKPLFLIYRHSLLTINLLVPPLQFIDPTTPPPTTQPPTQDPNATDPPVTNPPVTNPPATDSPATTQVMFYSTPLNCDYTLIMLLYSTYSDASFLKPNTAPNNDSPC